MDELRAALDALGLLIHVHGGELSFDQDLLEDFAKLSDGYRISVTPPCAISRKFVFKLVKSIDSPDESML